MNEGEVSLPTPTFANTIGILYSKSLGEPLGEAS